MSLPRHQLFGTFANSLRNLAPDETAMVQEKLEQVQIRSTQSFAQEKVVT
jgi:hypothetical protein